MKSFVSRPSLLRRPARMIALALLVLLPVSAAHAASDSAHLLLLPSDAVASGTFGTASASPATPTASPQPWTSQALVGAGATIVSVPVGLLLGTLWGGVSNNLLVAAIPSVILFAALPPLAVTWAEWLTGNWGAPGSVTFQPALWVALGVHLVATAVAIGLGVSSINLASVAIFTLIEAVLLPTAVTLTMRLTAPQAGAPAARAPVSPAVSPAAVAEATLSSLSPGRALALPRAPVLPVVAFDF